MQFVAEIVEVISAVIVIISVAISLWKYIGILFSDVSKRLVQQENIRLMLGRGLAFALEFELASDILKTTIAPRWRDVAMVGAIIVIRTVLNYFLEIESEKIRNIKKELQQTATELK